MYRLPLYALIIYGVAFFTPMELFASDSLQSAGLHTAASDTIRGDRNLQFKSLELSLQNTQLIAIPPVYENDEPVFGFIGPFQPSNWTFDADGGDGSVDTSGAPDFIIITGSDNQANEPNNTTYCIAIPGSLNGTIFFDWDYETFDNDGPQWDPFGYSVNGNFEQLTNDGGANTQSGSESVSVEPGDLFCFVAQSGDQLFGEAVTEISEFSFQTVESTTFLTTTTWTAPAGVFEITVEAWGGGGGGAPASFNSGKGAGGGGAYASNTFSVVPGTTYDVVIGTGGTPGNPGGNSFFGNGSNVLAVGGGTTTNQNGATGGQASASTGSVTFSGGDGGNGRNVGNQARRGGGGGGGSAFANANGENGTNGANNNPGTGGNGEGDGGDGGLNTTDASNGERPGGGGGGGGTNSSSGNGAAGSITITFETPQSPSGDESIISTAQPVITADGVETSTITVQAIDQFGANISFGGHSVDIFTTDGSLSGVTDNDDGTYSAILTSSTTVSIANITGTIEGEPIANTTSVEFEPGPASENTTLISAAPTVILSDGISTSTITVTARDQFENELTTGGDNVVLSTNAGSIGAATDNGNGTYTATLTSSTDDETATISGTINGNNIVDTAEVEFKDEVADPAQSTISSNVSEIIADGSSTAIITVQAKNSSGDNLTEGGDDVELMTTDGSISAVTDNTDGTYTATLTSSTEITTATVTGTINSATISDEAQVNFIAGPASGETTIITAAPVIIANDGTSTSTITVQAKDENDNNILTGGDNVLLNSSAGSLSGVTDNGDGTYNATLTSSTSIETATITGSINGLAISNIATVTFSENPDALTYYPGGLDNTNLVIWLDADDQSTISLNAGNVLQWDDKSLNNNHASQANASLQPEYITDFVNGRAAIQYASGDRLLTNLQPSELTDGVFVSIVNRTRGSGDRGFFGSWNNPRLYLMNRSGDYQTGFGDDWTLDGSYPENEFLIASLYHDGSEALGFIDGDLIHSYNSTFSGLNTNEIGIGTTNGVAGRDFIGELTEIVFYDIEFNITQRTIIDNYLTAKWGVSLNPAIVRFNNPTDFGNQLAGIGRETASDFVTETEFSSGGLGFISSTATGNFLNSNENYLMAAHNMETGIQNDTKFTPEGAFEIWERAWYIEKTLEGSEGDLTLYFDFFDYSVSPPSPSEDYVLLYNNSDPSFPVGTTVIFDNLDSISGNRVFFTFNSEDISNGYYTIGRVVDSAIYFSRQSGLWNDSNTWSFEGHDGPVAGFLPEEEDIVIVGGSSSSNHTVTLTDDVLLENDGVLTIADTGDGAGILATNGFIVEGSGSFNLDNGGTLEIQSPLGITESDSDGTIQTSVRIFSENANYIYNASVSQVTGDGLPVEVNNLTINNNQGVAATSSYRINGVLNMDSGNFEIGSNLSLIANTKNIISGELLFKRQIDGEEGYRMLTSPLDVTFDNFLSETITQGFPGASLTDTNPLQPNVLWYDETFEGTDNQRWRAPVNISNNVIPSRGYFVYFFGDVPGDGRYNDDFPITLEVNGQENEGIGGEIDFGVTFTPDGDDGWNLVGNPYGATIDWDHPSWTKNNIDPAIYVWDPNTNQYLTWNGSVGDITNGLISPFQAFWVKANDTNPELIISEDAKTLDTGVGFLGKNDVNKNEAPLISIEGYYSRRYQSKAHFTFTENGSFYLSGSDAHKLLPPPGLSDYLETYSRSKQGHRLAINNLPRKFGTVINIPLEVNLFENGLPVKNDIWLRIAAFENIPDDWIVSLINNQTNEKFPITGSNTSIRVSMDHINTSSSDEKHVTGYQVVTDDKSSHARFRLVIDPGLDAGGIPAEFNLHQNYPNPFNNSTTFRYDLPVESPVRLEVYDMLGRRVETIINGNISAGSHEQRWDASGLASGVYIARLVAGNSVFIKKLTLLK